MSGHSLAAFTGLCALVSNNDIIRAGSWNIMVRQPSKCFTQPNRHGFLSCCSRLLSELSIHHCINSLLWRRGRFTNKRELLSLFLFFFFRLWNTKWQCGRGAKLQHVFSPLSQRQSLRELNFSWENTCKSTHRSFFWGKLMGFRGFHRGMFQHPDHEAILILFSLGISRAEFSVPQLYPLSSTLKCYFMFLQLTLKRWKKIKQSKNKIKPKLQQTFKPLHKIVQ